MKRVLLVNSNTRDPARPTGLEYVAESMGQAGYEVRLLDLTVEDQPERAVTDCIAHDRYDAVGISIFNTQRDTGRDQVDFFLPTVQAMVADIRARTDAPVILGGYGFSLQPEDILAYVGADFAVAGCGVPAAVHLLRGIERGTVARGTVVREHEGEYLDVASKRDCVDTDKYAQGEMVSVSVSDGCTKSCFHCPTGHGRQALRLRDPAQVVAEVRNLGERGTTQVAFAYGAINRRLAYARSMCEAMADLPVGWSAGVWPVRECLPPDLADAMARSGMVRATIGSRTIGSDRMLKAYHQDFDSADLEYATTLLKERGIRTSWFLGFGAPGESTETIDETFALIDHAAPDDAWMMTRQRIYRHAPLARTAVDEGLVHPDDPLLEPVYYPFDDELRDHIWAEAATRDNCTVYY